MRHERIYLNPDDDRVFIDTYVVNLPRVRDAILVIPGGAYREVCTGREGEPIALDFVAKGYNAFVLGYRVGKEGDVFPKQLLDAAAAMIYIKEHAAELCINADRVFAVGFSAGGHLAAHYSTCFDCITYCYFNTSYCTIFRSNNRNLHLHCFQDHYSITGLHCLTYFSFYLEHFTGSTGFDLHTACCAGSCRCCYRSCRWCCSRCNLFCSRCCFSCGSRICCACRSKFRCGFACITDNANIVKARYVVVLIIENVEEYTVNRGFFICCRLVCFIAEKNVALFNLVAFFLVRRLSAPPFLESILL